MKSNFAWNFVCVYLCGFFHFRLDSTKMRKPKHVDQAQNRLRKFRQCESSGQNEMQSQSLSGPTPSYTLRCGLLQIACQVKSKKLKKNMKFTNHVRKSVIFSTFSFTAFA